MSDERAERARRIEDTRTALEACAGLTQGITDAWQARCTALLAERDALRAENARLREAIADAKSSWGALGACEDEFLPDYPDACSEYRDSLDGALVRLWQAACAHERAGGGFCAACGLSI